MKFHRKLEEWRELTGSYGSDHGSDYGRFFIPGPCGRTLCVIASSGDSEHGIEWEHVSVSTPKACPNWSEMCFIKDLFWDTEETVMQLHPPRSQWINNHPFCLHLWKPVHETIPLPPSIAVGDASLGTMQPQKNSA